MLAHKREQFELSRKKTLREEIFKKNRQTNKNDIPFCSNTQYENYSYREAFENGNLFPYQHSNEMELENSIESKIFLVQQLSNYFNVNDCDTKYETQSQVNSIFTVFNIGYPQIDKSCLHVLLAFSAGNHKQVAPMTEYLQILLDYFNQTPYILLKGYILDIFGNIAGDCYQCRDLILLHQIPILLWKCQSIWQDESMIEDFYTLIVNMDRIKPEINKYKLIELHELLSELFSKLKIEKNKQWILKLLNRIYQFDKSKITFKILDDIFYQSYSINLLEEIFKYFQFISLLDQKNNQYISQQLLIYILKEFSKQQQNCKQNFGQFIRISKRLCSILQNFILDNPQLIIYLLEQEDFIQIVQQPDDILLSQDEYYSLIKTCLKNSTNQEIQIINNNQNLLKNVILQLNIDEQIINQERQLDLLKIILILVTNDEQNLTYFIEEDAEYHICKIQHNSTSQLIADLAEQILNILDQY